MEPSQVTNPPASVAAATLLGRPVGRTGSPPWTQIVRGPELESAGAPANLSLSTTERTETNVGSLNSAAGSGFDSGPVVMGGASSWPALSESILGPTRPSHSTDSGSVAVPVPAIQVTGLASSSPSSSPLPPPSQQSSLTSQNPGNTNVNNLPSNNHGRSSRQRSMRRDGMGNAQANGGFSHQPLPHGEGFINSNSFVRPSSSAANESFGRDNNSQNHANRDSGPRNVGGGDHHQPRSNPLRRQNTIPHSRGDGTHQNYGMRRGDQDRGNHDWNHHRSFNGRDAPPMQSRGIGPRGFERTPPVSAPYVHPGPPVVPMHAYYNPMGMPDMHMLYLPPGGPYGAPVQPPMFFAPHDPKQQLFIKIVIQVDYYFSNTNLVKDVYLRENMDQNGWVPISLIATFSKVKQLTTDTNQILEALQSSSVVEVQGNMIRRRNDWSKWILPVRVNFQSPVTPNVATLSAGIQSVSLNEKTTDAKAELLTRSPSGNLNSSLHTSTDAAA